MRTKLMAMLALAAAGASANAQNLASNGSFETAGPGFILFQDWQNFGNVFDDASVEVTAQDGSVSAKMFGQFSGSQNDQVILQTVTGIVPGQEYTLSAYTNHLTGDEVAAGNVVLLQLNFQDGAGNGLSSVEVDAIEPGVTPTDEWNQVSVSAIAPAGTSQILIALLHLQIDGVAGGASFWDNVELVEGAPPSDCAADFNNDGSVNFFDIADFITVFNQGCP